MMADATMERSLAAAIDGAAAAGTLVWLVPSQYQHHRFQQEQDPAAAQQLLLPPYDDDHVVAGDVVAGLLDELSPRESDLDERILECPMIQRVLLLAMATLLQPDATNVDISQLLLDAAGRGEAYRNGGFGAVAAAASAVASLGKLAFHAAGAGGDDGSADHQSTCSICLEDFEEGEEVSVMPCSGGHGFHTHCIAEWLGEYSNMCPLCRHALPTATDDR